jgi:bifunctional non-homologous end joining protein LigD
VPAEPGPGAVRLSSPDKVLVPAAGGHEAITKADLFEYAGRIADRMVPLIADRPAVLQRFPDGIDGEGWYQKHTPKHFPGWIPTVELPKRGGTVRHVVIDSADALRYVVNQGTLTVHVLGGSVRTPDVPVELLIDLDPSTDDPAQVVAATAAVRELLDDLDVTGFVKTSGSRGIHVHVPLRGDARFDAVAALSRHLAATLAARHPDELTVEFAKDDRGDRLFVDVLRNAPAQHAVAPYTLRPRPGAPVAVPLRWDEVGTGWRPDSTPLASLFRRLGALSSDPWEGFDDARIDAATIAARLEALRT